MPAPCLAGHCIATLTQVACVRAVPMFHTVKRGEKPMQLSPSDCKLFSIVQTEHRGHLLNKVRMGANLMLRCMNAADAHVKEQCVAVSQSCLFLQRGIGSTPSACPRRFSATALLSIPVSDRLPTHVPHMQGFDRAGVQNERHADG